MRWTPGGKSLLQHHLFLHQFRNQSQTHFGPTSSVGIFAKKIVFCSGQKTEINCEFESSIFGQVFLMSKQAKRADYDLVRKAKAGDGRAYDALMEMYHDAVFNVIFRMVRNKQEAEDLTQETFIKAYNSINSFNETYAFSTWLFKIATNHCIDFFRKRKLVTHSLDEPIQYKDNEIKHEYATDEPNVDSKIVASEKSKIIREAINKLPEKYRIAIILRHHEEKSYEEIAQILNLPLGTVKARIFRAREMLKKYLKDALF